MTRNDGEINPFHLTLRSVMSRNETFANEVEQLRRARQSCSGLTFNLHS